MSVVLLKELLEKEHSKKNALFIAEKIINKEITFDILSKVILSNEDLYSQRAAWVISVLHEKNFTFEKAHYLSLVQMTEPRFHDAVARNSFRTLAKMKIDEKEKGILFDRGITLLQKKTTPTAILTWIIDLLMNIAYDSIELQQEIKLVIEGRIPTVSIGVKGKMVKAIQKINNNFKALS